MKFHLNHTPLKAQFEINHQHSLFLIGSCFSENIGHLLHTHKFNTLSNPGGILFNPKSIAGYFKNVLNKTEVTNEHLLKRENKSYSFLHHSSVNADSPQELINSIQTQNELVYEKLKTTDYIFITFGTAFYYHHKALNTTVANCHKLPSTVFEKRMVSTEEIVAEYSEIIGQLLEINPQLNIVFTVSPVKHLRDGVVENSLSKATLITSVHKLAQIFRSCSYFEAYELLTDDLRDYRFYKEDMAHPNEQAIEYIWNKFSECYFTPETMAINQKLIKLHRLMAHRPIQPNPEEQKRMQDYQNQLKAEVLKMLPALQL
ncbi:MAG: GSCFA domain-containing protein [Bacteroidia bacterium]|nr:GSCFA domain-containing protein [Bacteroidia bacterium]